MKRVYVLLLLLALGVNASNIFAQQVKRGAASEAGNQGAKVEKTTTGKSTNVRASNTGLPIQKTVMTAAPHLPAIAKYDGNGQQWHGDKYVYSKDSEAKIAQWAKSHPEEAAQFKAHMDNYLRTTDVTKLSTEEANVYYDLKAQWMMLVQL